MRCIVNLWPTQNHWSVLWKYETLIKDIEDCHYCFCFFLLSPIYKKNPLDLGKFSNSSFHNNMLVCNQLKIMLKLSNQPLIHFFCFTCNRIYIIVEYTFCSQTLFKINLICILIFAFLKSKKTFAYKKVLFLREDQLICFIFRMCKCTFYAFLNSRYSS